MSRTRLSNVDLAWLRMENPNNPMMITVLIRFKGQVDCERLILTIDEFLNQYSRFRQRIVRPGRILSRPYWEDDTDYRIENHLEWESLPFPADEASLLELVNIKLNTLLDFDQPLWKVTVVENSPEGSVLIVRIHHCIADGISLMRVLLQMTQPSTGAAAAQVGVNIPTSGVVPANTVSNVPQQISQNYSAEKSVLLPKVSENGNALPMPGRSLPFRKPNALEIIAATARIIFRSADPPTVLKAPLGPTKIAVWSEPYSVLELKRIAKLRQATINDVVMAATAGAIRRYIEERNDSRKENIRAFILVNLRDRTVSSELGNHFGLVFLTLPINQATALERLDHTKQGMDILKASAEYAASYMILNLLGQLPGWIERLAANILDKKGTVVSTNVPGPTSEITLGGTPIRSILAWVPQSGRIGVGLSFVSYNNQLLVGLNADAGIIPDPERFLQLFSQELSSISSQIDVLADVTRNSA